MPRSIPLVRFITLLLGSLVLFTGCNDDFIDPFQNEDHYFTLYGFLDPNETEHAVRVVPVTRLTQPITSLSDPAATIDARVTSTDLSTGEVHRWQHRIEQLTDGTFGHVFYGKFQAKPGRTYRLTVERADGETTTAETTIPFTNLIQEVQRGDVEIWPDSSVTQEIYLPGIASPSEITVVYFTWNNGLNGGQNEHHLIPYGRVGERTDDGGWRFTINLTADTPKVKSMVKVQGQHLVLDNMAVQVTYLDENWDPPGGLFNPEILAQPKTLSNVERGYGFWGSMGLFRTDWRVGRDFSLLIGYDWWANCPGDFLVDCVDNN